MFSQDVVEVQGLQAMEETAVKQVDTPGDTHNQQVKQVLHQLQQTYPQNVFTNSFTLFRDVVERVCTPGDTHNPQVTFGSSLHA